MNTRLLLIGTSMFLFGCSEESVSVAPEEGTTEQHNPLREPDPVIASEETKDVPIEDNSDTKSLQNSYENAVIVRDIMLQETQSFSPEVQEALAPALQSFSDDIDSLQYYIHIAQLQELQVEENAAVVYLITEIEQAMSFFSDILELLL